MRGATLVWSDAALGRELDDYIATRRWSTHKLLYELLAWGAPIYTVADVADLASVEGPLVVLHPQAFPPEELASVLYYDRGPLILIGQPVAGGPAADLEFADVNPPGELHGAVYRAPRQYAVNIAPDEPENLPEDLAALPEPPTFVQELYFRRVSPGFLQACAEILRDCARAAKVLDHPDVIRVQSLERNDGVLRLLIGNDSNYYVPTQVDVGAPIAQAHVVTSFPGSPPATAGSILSIRVPGPGMVIVDVTRAD